MGDGLGPSTPRGRPYNHQYTSLLCFVTTLLRARQMRSICFKTLAFSLTRNLMRSRVKPGMTMCQVLVGTQHYNNADHFPSLGAGLAMDAKKLDKEVARYMRRFKKALEFRNKQINENAMVIRAEISSYMETHPNIYITDMYKRFGSPESFARKIMDDSPDDVIQKGCLRKRLKRIGMIALTLISVLIIGFFIFFLWDYNKHSVDHVKDFLWSGSEMIVPTTTQG